MKPIMINFTDSLGKTTKTYSACSIKTGTMDLIFDMAERVEAYQQGGLDIRLAKSFFNDLKAIIVEVFGGQFSFDELNKNVEQGEIMKVFKELCANVTGEITKK